MQGIYFYLQILFAILMLWAIATVFYSGIFRAGKPTAGSGRKAFCAVLSTVISCVICFFMYSWSYLSW